MRSLRYIMGAAARRRASAPPPSSIEWVATGAIYQEVSALTTHPVAVPAAAQVGDMLLISIWPFGSITSVQTNTSQSLSLLATYASAGEVGRIYGVVISGSVPTTINVNLSAGNDLMAQAHVARGVTQVNGIVDDGNDIGARTNLTYNSGAAESLILTIYTASGSFSREVATATYTGGASFDFKSLWPFSAYRTLLGVHNGATGANNIPVTWNEADTSGGRWMSIALVP